MHSWMWSWFWPHPQVNLLGWDTKMLTSNTSLINCACCTPYTEALLVESYLDASDDSFQFYERVTKNTLHGVIN